MVERALSWAVPEGKLKEYRIARACRIAVVGVGRWGNRILKSLNTDGLECFAVDPDEIEEERGLCDFSRFEQVDMMFVIANVHEMSSGAASSIADVGKKGVLVVGLIGVPVHAGGSSEDDFEFAVYRLNQIGFSAHTTAIINDITLDTILHGSSDSTVFSADEIVKTLVDGTVETLNHPSFINIDFADFKALASRGGIAVVGMGENDGPKMAQEAAECALKSMGSQDLKHARGALILLKGANGIGLGDAVGAAEAVTGMIDRDAMAMWGAHVDSTIRGIRVTVMLTDVRSTCPRDRLLADTTLFDLDPTLDHEGPIDLGVDLFQMDTAYV